MHSPRSGLSGALRDQSGRSFARILKADENTPRTVKANDNGESEALNEKPGKYTIEITAPGLKPRT